jgi:NAD(P)-dependent dehydrogenase (short-subunit alcohol dehydrogenase family)
MSLDNKVGIITGGASGIGAEIVKSLIKAGSFILIADINEEKAHKLIESLTFESNECKFIYCDVSNPKDCEKAIEFCLKEFKRLDFLVNSAGTIITGSLKKTSLDDWGKVINTNLLGTYLMTKYSVPYLKKGNGCIVNIASIAGLVGFRNISAYCASKGGVIAFSRAIALELISEGIRVNCICPGSVATPFMEKMIEQSHNKEAARRHATNKTPMKRAADPSEIAPLVVFLLDEKQSSYMTGSVISIDGGYTIQ